MNTIQPAREERGFSGGATSRVSPKASCRLSAVAGIWLLGVAAAMVCITKYSESPGPAENVPFRWPSQSPVSLARTNPTLVMFAHPRCPCTRARLIAAERLLKLQSQVKQLAGLVPICAVCKKIRDDKNYWQQVETYVAEHADAKFSHGYCPECFQTLVKEIEDRNITNGKSAALTAPRD